MEESLPPQIQAEGHNFTDLELNLKCLSRGDSDKIARFLIGMGFMVQNITTTITKESLFGDKFIGKVTMFKMVKIK